MNWAPDVKSVLSKKIKPAIDLILDKDGIAQLSAVDQQVYDFQTYRNALFGIPTDVQHNHTTSLQAKQKHGAKSLFVSATPAKYELTLTDTVVEQVIRPT